MSFPLGMSVPSPLALTESPVNDLEALIRSRTPLIAIETDEASRVVEMVCALAGWPRFKTCPRLHESD